MSRSLGVTREEEEYCGTSEAKKFSCAWQIVSCTGVLPISAPPTRGSKNSKNIPMNLNDFMYAVKNCSL
ncbi:hypothetical protein [Flavobacterium sp.]|uniref:hypothetical protein n=1 Tax=Flavobacterium sp. TaxID=239 RepID=UPI0025C064F6|nr:hypothetical protein [Flavobacterium sp.]